VQPLTAAKDSIIGFRRLRRDQTIKSPVPAILLKIVRRFMVLRGPGNTNFQACIRSLKFSPMAIICFARRFGK
jgi:hypothetical protein